LFEIWQSAGAHCNYPLGPEARGGLSDGNLLWDYVPTLDGLGPYGENGHCAERNAAESKEPEFVDRISFVPKAVLNALAILRLAETAGIRHA
jgi:glutamate carboxypeptidase